jgi:hypothetical protein
VRSWPIVELSRTSLATHIFGEKTRTKLRECGIVLWFIENLQANTVGHLGKTANKETQNVHRLGYVGCIIKQVDLAVRNSGVLLAY